MKENGGMKLGETYFTTASIMQETGWQRDLHVYSLSLFISSTGYMNEDVLYHKMQEKYPGPYTIEIEEGYHASLVFDDPKKELLWKMKYS